MALDLTPEQRELGQANFKQVSKDLAINRRDFMKDLAAGGMIAPVAAATYFGYRNASAVTDRPVRAALIGAGDEGGVLVGEHNPKFIQFVAYSDIRPSNQKRIFDGQPGTIRRGFNYHYGPECVKDIQFFENYHDLLADKKLGIEAIVTALPLNKHAPVVIDCLNAGKHVLCEKLMAWNITQCKAMIKASEKNDRILTIGHQRHYSLLYAQALEAIHSGILGDIKHIRALWHRNNSWPERDKSGKPIPGEIHDSWLPKIKKEDREALEKDIVDRWDFKTIDELVRWRLFNRTGAGLMAELGSHQLDACSIFLNKVRPLAVSGVGGKFFYRDGREVDDHVFVTFEFPGPNYYVKDDDGRVVQKAGKTQIKDKDDIVVVTYSSINTNSSEKYGECVMGTRGTLIVEEEQRVLLYGERDPLLKGAGAPRSTAVGLTTAAGGKPVIDSTSTTGGIDPLPGPGAPAAAEGPPSRGYREEMEHFAYCIRMHQAAKDAEERKQWRLTPHCHGEVAMADAIYALTSNQAMKRHERIAFQDAWFDPASPEVPDKDMIPLDAKGQEIKL